MLLKVELVGFCGSDLNTFRGRNPLAVPPRVPGHEVAATVVACGLEVPDTIYTGMRVTLSPYTNCGICPSCRHGRPNACQFNQTLGVQRDGALAEFITTPWRKLYYSDRLSLRELALVEPLTVGFHAVARGEVAKDDKVLILGCGAIGLGAVAGAAWRGAEVTAVDIDDAKLATAGRIGATHLVNTAKSNLHEELGRLTNGGPDAVIEAIGLPVTFKAAVE